MARKKTANSMGIRQDFEEKTKRITDPIIVRFQIDPIKVDGKDRFCIGGYNAADRCMVSIGAVLDPVTSFKAFSEEQKKKMLGLVDVDPAGPGFIYDTCENAKKVISKIIRPWNEWQLKEYTKQDIAVPLINED